MKRTLGGDRLGVGKKMEVDMRSYSKSNHDLGYIWRSTMSAGTLVPFLKKLALPGDTFDIDLNAHVNTHPTIGPLFGSLKLQLDVFLVPIRLYNPALHNNLLNVGNNMKSIKLPQVGINHIAKGTFKNGEDLDKYGSLPSSLYHYLGYK